MGLFQHLPVWLDGYLAQWRVGVIMANLPTFAKGTNGNVDIRSWVFANDNEIDIELWVADRYLTTLTISTASGKIIHQALAADLEVC